MSGFWNRCKHCKVKFAHEDRGKRLHPECIDAWSEAFAAEQKRKAMAKRRAEAKVERALDRKKKAEQKAAPAKASSKKAASDKPAKKKLWPGLKDLYPQKPASEVDVNTLKQRLLVLSALANLHHHAVVREQAVTFVPRDVAQHAHLLAVVDHPGRGETDVSNASRTMLYDIHRGAWDDELLALFGDVPEAALPEVLPSIGEFGTLRDGALGAGHDGVPVSGIAGDQQAALYGQACHSPGLGKNTYGTGNFLLQNAGSRSPLLEQGLITTIAWGIDGRVDYALESSMFVTGAAVQFLRDGLKIIEQASDTEAMAASLDSNDGVYFVPALTGLGSPHWDPYARGTLVTKPAESFPMIRASSSTEVTTGPPVCFGVPSSRNSPAGAFSHPPSMKSHQVMASTDG
mgnify:CR=1 FL=1